MPRIKILGVKIDNISFEDAVKEGVRLMSGKQAYIVTPNPEFLIYAQNDPQFTRVLNNADLAIPDGVGLIWASRRLGQPVSERVAGADLAERLVAEAAKRGFSVFFLGARGNIAERAAQAMQRKYPGLKVLGAWSGDPRESGDKDTLARIGTGRVDLLLVAYGHPKQEYWVARNLSKLNVGTAMGVGGAFDFWSGEVRRAPDWMRSLGLEWLFRLVTQPWRIKRQLALLKFVWLTFSR